MSLLNDPDVLKSVADANIVQRLYDHALKLETELQQRMFHHKSQAKEPSVPCSRTYHANVAAHIRKLLDYH